MSAGVAGMEQKDREARARANRRTALVLATIALAFFIGVVVKYLVFQ